MTVWTEDRIGRLKRLWREGRTAESISHDLGAGISRSAVLGKVHRLGLSVGRAKQSPCDKTPRRKRASARPQPAADAPAEDRLMPAAPSTSGRRTVLTARRGDCRWPFGDPRQPGFSLCGRPVCRGAFCAAHAAIAYRGAPQTFEQLARLAGVW